jgi:hypothetical protein
VRARAAVVLGEEVLGEQIEVVVAAAQRRQDGSGTRAAGRAGPRAATRRPPRGADRGWSAAITRTSTVIGSLPPTRCTVLLSSARRSFTCRSADISVISSRKSVPPSARSKQPKRRSVAPVKLPFSWPNSSDSIRFGEIAPQLSGTNGCVGARAELVQRLGDQLLARAGLAGHEHGGVGARDLLDLVVDRLHRGRRADHPAEAPEPAQLLAQRAHLPAQPRRALDVRENLFEPPDVDRLGEIVGDAAADRAHGGVDARVAGHEHDVHRGRSSISGSRSIEVHRGAAGR